MAPWAGLVAWGGGGGLGGGSRGWPSGIGGGSRGSPGAGLLVMVADQGRNACCWPEEPSLTCGSCVLMGSIEL